MANRRASTEMRRMQMRVAQRQAQRYGGAKTPLLEGTNNDGSFRAMAEGGTVGGTAPPMKLPPVPQPTLTNRKAVLDALEEQAVNPTPAAPQAAQAVPPNPLQTQIIPGLADQMAAKQAARMKAEADEAMKNPAKEPQKAGFVQNLRSRLGFANGGDPGDDSTQHMNDRKHFSVWSGGMADGGQVGLRRFAAGGYTGVQPRHPEFMASTSEPQNTFSPWNTSADAKTPGLRTMGDWGKPEGGSIGKNYGTGAPEPQTIYNYSMADGGQLPLDPKWAAANHPLLMMYKHYADGGYLTDDRYDHTTVPRGQRYPAHGMGPDLDVRGDAKYKQFFGLRTHEDDMNGTAGTRQNQAQANPHFADGGAVGVNLYNNRERPDPNADMFGLENRSMDTFAEGFRDSNPLKVGAGVAGTAVGKALNSARAGARELARRVNGPAPTMANGGEIQIQRAVFANGGWVFPGAVSTAQGGMRPNTNVNPQNGFPMKVDGGSVGPLQVYPDGGKIRGKGGPTEDRQPVLASPKEYILPADTVQKVGKHNLDKLRHATHTPVHKHGMRGMNMGGEPVDLPTPPVRGFANGTAGSIGESLGGQVPYSWNGSKFPESSVMYSNPSTITPSYAGPQRGSRSPTFDLASMASGPTPGMSSFASTTPTGSSQRSFDPSKPPTVGESTSNWSGAKINPKTGYPMLADGGMPTGLRGWPKMADGTPSWWSQAQQKAGDAWDWTKSKLPGGGTPAPTETPLPQIDPTASDPYAQFEKPTVQRQGGFRGTVPEADWSVAPDGTVRPTPKTHVPLGDTPTSPNQARTLGSQSVGIGEDLANRGAGQGLRGIAGNVGRFLGSVRGATGIGAATYSPETSEPADTKIPQNTGMQLTPGAMAMSDRERYQLIQDVNSGDPMKAEAARLRLVGAKPTPAAAAAAPTASSSGRTAEDRGAGATTTAPAAPAGTPEISNANVTPEKYAGFKQTDTTDWGAKNREFDARKAAENQQLTQGWERQNNMGNRNQALYEARVAQENLARFPNDPGLRAQYADAVGRAGMYTQGVNIADTHAAELARAKLGTEAAKYGHEMGLRGQMIGAQANVLGHQISAEASLAGHKYQYDLGRMQMERQLGKENMEDFDKTVGDRMQVIGADNKPDLAATQKRKEDFMRYFADPTEANQTILQKVMPGARSIRDIPKNKWGPLIDQYNAMAGLAQATGGQGLPSDMSIRKRGLGDAFTMPGGPIGPSKVGFWSGAANAVNPFAPPERDYTVRQTVPGSLPTDITLEDLGGGDRNKQEAALSMLERGTPEQKQIAAQFRQRWGLR